MKKAQVDEMMSIATRLERDLQPGRWDKGVADEEASFDVSIHGSRCVSMGTKYPYESIHFRTGLSCFHVP